MSKILVVGSLAFDVIFDIHGDIKKEIPLRNGVIDNINLMFTAKNKKEYFGGTAGNISYGLGLLKEKPLLFSLAGKDFKFNYKEHLKKHGVDLKVIEKEEEYTATFYGISDEKRQQIGIWQPNAYGNWIEKTNLLDTISKVQLKGIKIAIFSPGTGISTRNMISEFREINKNATVIFDPSQVLSIYYKKTVLMDCLLRSNIFIGNETEVAQLKTIFDLDIKAILDTGLQAVIETKGEKGVTIHQFIDNKREYAPVTIKAFKPRRIMEATGAGDAFRSGLIYGLAHNRSIVDSCIIGSFMGAKCVEEFGGQLYSIDKKELSTVLK